MFSGLVMAWRLAICPTSRSFLSVMPTTDGVVRLPSALAMTTGSPPLMIATQELVVPKSMPMTLPMMCVLLPLQAAEKTRQLRSHITQRLNVQCRVRLAPSLAAALLDGFFEQPVIS